ncbi:Protein-export protein SecB [Flavobacterium anhuiense]|uniref:Protein-export protein SecB n=1 Tax=Flavobacterium anhuiense TaxID=459526 RepID=A0AAC9GGN8_9FLAO|nr:protein-export chaperone SecB [Flavobacterium anhuiense]AOC93468.1 Protein-export protein SecB [Flavobacterium anhuiense]
MSDNKTYKLKSLSLIESNFRREAEIDFSAEIDNQVDIDIQHTLISGDVIISLKVDLIGKYKRKKLFRFTTNYLGVFEIGNEDILPVEKFVEANGPAIIYPFIREHIAGTSLKAGMKAVLLPPVNFIKLSQDNKAKKATMKN